MVNPLAWEATQVLQNATFRRERENFRSTPKKGLVAFEENGGRSICGETQEEIGSRRTWAEPFRK